MIRRCALLAFAALLLSSVALAKDPDFYKRTGTKPPSQIQLYSEAGAFWYNGLGLSGGLGWQAPKGPKISFQVMYGHLNGIDQTIDYQAGYHAYSIPVEGKSKTQWGLMFVISNPINPRK